MNPATFLRVNGPEPWNVCYPEPSVRPDDSRYGNNPNRVQRHTQFQVIMKPDPGNPQELYLGSLEALGIDTRAHDIRFVEDNWVGRLYTVMPVRLRATDNQHRTDTPFCALLAPSNGASMYLHAFHLSHAC